MGAFKIKSFGVRYPILTRNSNLTRVFWGRISAAKNAFSVTLGNGLQMGSELEAVREDFSEKNSHWQLIFCVLSSTVKRSYCPTQKRKGEKSSKFKR